MVAKKMNASTPGPRHRRNPDTKVFYPDAAVCPVCVITYAWGKHYVDTLCQITLPAILAPGNLHYLSSFTSCEVVILTQEAFFSQFDAAPAVRKIREICPVRLISLDDLVSRKDNYGMALTYALHRGCNAYGAAMTDTWFLFLNADFILANNCWRRLIPYLAHGIRLVCAPSYCVDAHEVAPTLLERVDSVTSSLSLSLRAMAALAIEHPHDTVRAKTLNTGTFQTRYVDQFYWQADNTTLLGRQMPVAVVGLWPERHVQEPKAFWDYGLIREFCPDSHIEVLGDSDDFMMIELRNKEVAQEAKVFHPMQPFEIAQLMVTWVTNYQRNFTCYPLILHSGDIPPDAAAADNELKSRVDEILSYCPEFLPSSIGHPQWAYHLTRFMTSRHEFLSRRLGGLTEGEPSESLSELDKIWWRLDGLRKRYHRERAALERAASDAIDDLKQQILGFKATDQLKATSKIDWLSIEVDHRAETIFQPIMLPKSDGSSNDPMTGNDLDRPVTLADHANTFVTAAKERIEAEEKRSELLKSLETHFGSLQAELEQNYEVRRRPLEIEYARYLQLDNPILLPDVKFFRDPGPENLRKNNGSPTPGDRDLRTRLQRRLELRALRDVKRILADAGLRRATNILTVGSSYQLIHGVADHLPGAHASVSLGGLLSSHFHKYFDPVFRFDFCLCDITADGLPSLQKIVDAVRPFLDAGGTIVAIHRMPEGKVRSGDFNSLPVKSVRILLARPPIGIHLLRALIISARSLGLMRVKKWILRRASAASEELISRTIAQLWHLVATDLAWRSVTIVLRGLFQQVPEQRSDKKPLLVLARVLRLS